jgi:predicted phage tail protein
MEEFVTSESFVKEETRPTETQKKPSFKPIVKVTTKAKTSTKKAAGSTTTKTKTKGKNHFLSKKSCKRIGASSQRRVSRTR